MAGGLEFNLMVSIGVVSVSERFVVCSFLRSTKRGGRCNWAIGSYVKMVFYLFCFEGFPNRFLLVGFSPSLNVVLFYMRDLCRP